MESITNFHTHTNLCKHAEGTPQDYIDQAAKEGCSALGFSDHCPYPESFFDYWPHIRMSVEDIPVYKQWIDECRDTAPFPLFMGFECEWDPAISGWYTDELKSRYNAQYLVFGPHWVTDGSTHIYTRDIDSPSMLNKYIDQTVQGMASGAFSFVAHPDLFLCGHTFYEWDEQTKACSQAIIDAASDLNLPLEINGLGMNRALSDTKRGMRYAYPYLEFWEMVAQSDAKVICNSDAHNPKDVIFNAWRARDFASRFGFEIESVPMKLDIITQP